MIVVNPNSLFQSDENREDVKQIDPDINDYLSLRLNGENTFIESFTSGSTGEPKRIKIAITHLEASARKTCEFLGLKQPGNYLLSLPVKFIAGKIMVERALMTNSNLVIVKQSLNPLLGVDFNSDIDLAAFTPAQVYEIIHSEKSNSQFKKIKNVLIGGAPLPRAIEEKLSHYPNRIFITFGMTETMSHFALRKPNEAYYTLISNEIKINTNESQGLQVSIPYLGIENLITNDVVKIHNNSSFEWIGRADYTINSGGLKLHPEQIEKKIEKYYITDGTPFFLYGVPNEKFGEQIILLIEGDPKDKHINTQDWTKLGQYEIPKSVKFVKKFLRTATGKIRRKETMCEYFT